MGCWGLGLGWLESSYGEGWGDSAGKVARSETRRDLI